MKLYTIGQLWPNEPLFVNKLSCILNSWLVWSALNEKLAAQNPGRNKVVQFFLTFPSGQMTTTLADHKRDSSSFWALCCQLLNFSFC